MLDQQIVYMSNTELVHNKLKDYISAKFREPVEVILDFSIIDKSQQCCTCNVYLAKKNESIKSYAIAKIDLNTGKVVEFIETRYNFYQIKPPEK